LSRIIKLNPDAEAVFIKRNNRFLATVDIIHPFNQREVHVHIHDPGRLKEILKKGTPLLLKKARNPGRKTAWDAIAGKVDDIWVLIHSGYHRKIAEEILKNPEISLFGKRYDIQPEPKYKNSRLDFLLKGDDETIWIETKGCTLAVNKTALFPDAPTQRGKRHVEHLIEIKNAGKRAAVIFLVFRSDAEVFSPNWETDPEFSKALREAKEKGVEIHALKLSYNTKEISFIEPLPINL